MNRRWRAVVAGLATTATAAGLVGCGGSGGKTIVVDAAASLTPTFTTLARQFEQAHPGVHVRLNFGGSDTLAAQITQGAPVDVFASASTTTMQTVVAAHDAAGTPQVFVRNQPELAVPPSNPAHIESLADSARRGVKLVLCAPTVPCGAAADTVYRLAHLKPHPVSQEPDVTSVLSKVELGEADAGVVYVTDVRAAGAKVKAVPIGNADQAITSYPIVVTKQASDPTDARAFIRYVRSTTGIRLLRAAGFLPP